MLEDFIKESKNVGHFRYLNIELWAQIRFFQNNSNKESSFSKIEMLWGKQTIPKIEKCLHFTFPSCIMITK